MKTICCCLIIFTFGLPLGAEDTAKDPAARFGPDGRSAYLRWKQARKDADLAYVRELRAALEKATRAGTLEEAVAIQAEIKRVKAQHADDPGKIPLAEFLVGTTWASSFNGATVTFKEDGKAVRTMKGRDTAVGYRVKSEKEFAIQWTAAVGECLMAPDRRSFKSGDATWSLQP